MPPGLGSADMMQTMSQQYGAILRRSYDDDCIFDKPTGITLSSFRGDLTNKSAKQDALQVFTEL